MKKLPVWLTFLTILRGAVTHIDIGFKLIWPWALILGPIYTIYAIWIGLHPLTLTKDNAGQFALTSFFAILLAVVYGYAFASIAIGWHRYALLQEQPRGLSALNLNGRSWRYLLNFIGMAFLLAIVVIIVFAIISIFYKGTIDIGLSTIGTSWRFYGIDVAIFLVFTAFSTRLFLKLVGIALGDDGVTFGSVLDASVDNMLRLIGLSGLFLMLSKGIEYMDQFIAVFVGTSSSDIEVALLMGMNVVVQGLDIFVGIITLTILYAYFVQGREIGTTL